MNTELNIKKMSSTLIAQLIRDDETKLDNADILANTKFMQLSDDEIKKLFDISFSANFDTDKYISGIVIDTHTFSVEKIINKIIELFDESNEEINGAGDSESESPLEEQLLLKTQPLLHKLKAKLCVGFYVSDFKPVSDYEFKAINMLYKVLSINQQIDFVKSSHAEEIKFANGHFLTNIKVYVSPDINGTLTIKHTFTTHDKTWHKQIYEKSIVLEGISLRNQPKTTSIVSVECTKNQYLQALSFNAKGNISDDIPTMKYTATCSTVPGVDPSKRSDAILSYKILPELLSAPSSLVVVPAKNDTPEKAAEAVGKKQYIENIYIFLLIILVLFVVFSTMYYGYKQRSSDEPTSN
jgi:hypothetical protein